MLVKHLIFGQTSKFWSKNTNLLKNQNFGQKSKLWSKIEILVKNRNFGQKSKFCSNVEIVVKNRNFGQKSKFRSEKPNLRKKPELWFRHNRFPKFYVNRHSKSGRCIYRYAFSGRSPAIMSNNENLFFSSVP